MPSLGAAGPLALFLFSLASLISAAAADVASSCFILGGNGDNLTIAVNVPSSNVNDDLYFRLIAPAFNSWVGFGFGNGMAGALMFVVYAAGDQKNVTISPRLGTGHVMPQYTDTISVNLLAGSGVIEDSNGLNLVVNARCENCRKWGVGSVDVTSEAQSMIYGVGGDQLSIASNDLTQSIAQHVGYGIFTMDMVAATGPGGVPTNTNAEDGVHHILDVGQDGGPGGGVHGFFMCASFIVLFPAGYLFYRLFNRMWIHMTLQSLGLLAVLLGAASGIVVSIKSDKNPKMNSAHQAIGFVVVIGVIAQWTLGMVHHRLYKKNGLPTPMIKIHRIAGPAVIGIGLVNGALGLNFAGKNLAIIGYAVVVLLMVIFVSTLMLCAKRRQRRKEAMNTPAAFNFREGQTEGAIGPGGEPVPLQRVPYQGYDSGPPPQYGAMPGHGNEGRV